MSKTETPTTQSLIPSRRWPSTAQIAIVVAILGGAVSLTATTSDVTKVSEPGVKLYPDGTPFLVDQAGNWTGGARQGLSKEEQDLLPKDTEGSRRLFKNKHGDELYCSIILAGSDPTSVHRPELCLPGQGWRIQNEYTQAIPVAGATGGTLSVMRMNATSTLLLPDGRTTQTRSIFAYWFVGKDRVTPYHWQRIYWTAKDRVLHNTNHRWAYILIHVSMRNDTGAGEAAASEDDAMKIMTSFVQSIYPTLVEK